MPQSEYEQELQRVVDALRAEVEERKSSEAVFAARARLSEFALGHTLGEVLTRTLDEAELLTGSSIGFFHFVEADQVTLSLQTWSTNTRQKMCKAAGQGVHYPANMAGVWADALREKRPVVHNDYAHLAHRKGLPDGHAPVSRELVVPIIRQERVKGLLGVGNALREYGPKDIERVSLLANLAWDIVLTKRAEQAHLQGEALLRQTQAFSHVGGWEYDPRTTRLAWTPEVGVICEVGPGEDLEANLSAFFSPRDRELVSAAYRRAIVEDAPFDLEVELIGARGTRRWVRLGGRAEQVEGKVTRVYGNLMDVTERRRMLVQIALDDRLSAMGMLAAGVGHELNNPLAYVLSNVDSLSHELPRVARAAQRCSAALLRAVGEAAYVEALDGDVDALGPTMLDDLLECATSSLDGARRIQGVSRRLGAFGRVERDELLPFDLNLAVEAAVSMAHNELKFRASLSLDLGVLPSVNASERRLSQLFLNLISNAAHAIEEGEVAKNRVTVRTWAEREAVFVEVEDTGCGIPAENLDRVFEPFFSTRPFGAGSGLGLPISRNIVRELGGELRITSVVGQGTRVLVELPVAMNKKLTVAPPVAAVPRPKGRVMVIDDEEPIRRSLVRLLSREHEVVAAASGREAIMLLEADPRFDVVLCDLMMPELTGMQLHAWLEAHAPALARRVVFVTGGAFTPNAASFLASVPNPRVDKPYVQADLKRLVAELVHAAKR